MRGSLLMAETSKTGGASRLTRIVLVLSLALNLAIIGLLAGAAASGRFGEDAPRSYDLGLGPVARALEGDERRRIGDGLRRDSALHGVDLRRHAENMIVIIRTEPFDGQALRDLMARQDERAVQLRSRALELMIQEIAEMNAERRAAFADQLLEEMSKRRGPGPRESGG